MYIGALLVNGKELKVISTKVVELVVKGLRELKSLVIDCWAAEIISPVRVSVNIMESILIWF